MPFYFPLLNGRKWPEKSFHQGTITISVRPPICAPDPNCVLYMYFNGEHTISFRHTNRGSYLSSYSIEFLSISQGANFYQGGYVLRSIAYLFNCTTVNILYNIANI